MGEEVLVRFVGVDEKRLAALEEQVLDSERLSRLQSTLERLIESHGELRKEHLKLRAEFDELVGWAMSSDRPPAFTGTRIQQLEAALYLANQRIKGDTGPPGKQGPPGLDGKAGPPGDAGATVIREVKISG